MSIIETFWKSLKGNTSITQLERYQKNNSPEYIQKFIALGGGQRMGTTLEKFARYKFSILEKRGKGKNTGFDHKFVLGDKVICLEQKSSGYWRTGKIDNFKWQHIEPNHKWDILLFCGIEYNDIRFWAINRTIFNKLVAENKITNQGNNQKESSEGLWCYFSDIQNHLIMVDTNDDLLRLVE